MPERDSVQSAAPPYVDCIQWVPRRFANGPSPVTLADIVFTQAALSVVRETVAARPDASVFGLLLGDVMEDPTCARRWVRVTAVQRGPVIAGDASAETLGRVIDGMPPVENGPRVVGWFRSHPGAGLYLSPEEARLHDARFDEPWSFAMIMVGDAGRLTGGIFQRTRPEGLSRSAYTPFYELVHPSSEFNGTTRRTYVDWPNYQTETRVVQAGRGSVSAQIPDGGGTLLTPEPAAETAAPVADAAAARSDAETRRAGAPVSAPATGSRPDARSAPGSAAAVARPAASARPAERGAAARGREEGGGKDGEAEWERKQIQRSLMAVGRSIGPSSGAGDLATPVPVGAERDRAGSGAGPSNPAGPAAAPSTDAPEGDGRDAVAGGHGDPAAARGSVRGPTPAAGPAGGEEDRSVIPIRPGAIPRTPPRPALVGRARRKKSAPVGKALAAAAAVFLVSAAGWFGSQRLAGGPSSVAGVSLAPTDLFTREPRASDPPGPGDPGAEGSVPGAVMDEGLAVTDEGAPSRIQDPLQGEDGESATGDGTPSTDGRPAPPRVEELVVPDPVVSAYRNATSIFREEAQRYEEAREAFDRNQGSCNALNLAFRGVRDAHRRLDRRFRAASERFAGPELREFEGAGRQMAMIETHYTLTDCPMPPGT